MLNAMLYYPNDTGYHQGCGAGVQAILDGWSQKLLDGGDGA